MVLDLFLFAPFFLDGADFIGFLVDVAAIEVDDPYSYAFGFADKFYVAIAMVPADFYDYFFHTPSN
jgi:hypothetical protein